MTTITEDYCDFEIAKLLKKKGFDIPCNCYGAYNGVNLTYRLCITDKYTNWNKHTDKFIISCPTLQMAMKWLREVYNFHIWVEPSHDKEGLYNAHVKVDWWSNNWAGVGYNTYEKAVEAAIEYCLKILI